MKSSRAPGPDCFPSEFYKAFSNLLCPMLSSVFTETLRLPSTFNQAQISLLLKKGKGPLEYSSYWPISLLNSGYKLLATRVEGTLHQVIAPDQIGFSATHFFRLWSFLRWKAFDIVYIYWCDDLCMPQRIHFPS